MSGFQEEAARLLDSFEGDWKEESCDAGTRTPSTSRGAVTRTARTAAPSAAATAATAAPAALPSALCADCGHGHHPAEGCDEAAYYRDIAEDRQVLYLLPRVWGSALLRIADRDGAVVYENYSGTELVRWARACDIKIKKWPGEDQPAAHFS
jgi:hypothetical protein